MLASIAARDMAETMQVLAGGNAVSAARHFTRYSFELGDAASVALWSRTMQELAGPSRPPARPALLTTEAATESRLVRERDAFLGVRYEDVDAAALALEEPPAIVVRSAEDWTGERFGFVRTGTTRTVANANAAVRPSRDFARAA
jgi:hypothetical protein